MTTEYPFIGDSELVEMAKTEINEDPKKIKAHIEGLRRWLKSQEHLSCMNDDEFLLRFLRAQHFDQMKSQEMLEAFCKVRNVEASDWFSYPQDIQPTLEFIKEGFMLPIGVNKSQEMVVLFRSGLWDPTKVDFSQMIQSMCLCFDILLLNPRIQIAGIVAIVDFDQFSQIHVTSWSNESVAKLMLMQKALPMRIKDVHYYRTSVIVDGIFKLFQLFMDPEIMNKVKWHRHDEDALKSSIGEDILPQEYGGTHGPIATLIDNWVKEVEEKFPEVEKFKSIAVDVSKRPHSDVSLLGDYVAKLNESLQGL